MSKVKGIGGIFFKCQDPQKLKEWYNEKIGLATDQYGAGFRWLQADGKTEGFTQWSLFPDNTDYFEPSQKEFMINYIVEDLEELVEELKAKGVTILDEISVYDYGKFIHIADPEGNKIELWELK
ncbi:VOC family protein [Candidatus Cloacimonadota bacterium]|jgi:lactoylglutathione lyase|nr:VOC family protein [Candidatus Cloacimonadota bacterium]MDD3236075.1 VOC family protein [Candidatus Cloacimonadota bacterium]